MFSNPSLNWEKLQDTYYRSRLLAKLEWSNKRNLRYAISLTFIAIETDTSIQVYNYLGDLLTELDFKLFNTINKFVFDENDPSKLIVVGLESFKVIQSWSPLDIKTINLPSHIQDVIWDYNDGIVILKESKDILRYNSIKKEFETVIKNNGRYTVLNKKQWHCNKEQIIILDINHVYRVNLITNELTKFRDNNEWHIVTISTNGFICLFNSKFNKLNILKDSDKILLEHTLVQSPIDIKWCGDDSIGCSFEDEIKLYGPNGNYVSFWFPTNIFALRTEVDGLKVFTDTDVHIITKVSEYTSNVFRIGSTEAGSMLYDAYHLIPDHAPRAIDYLKNFDLKKGVIDCIDAAKEEMDPQLQKELLNAASFGKSALPYKDFDSDTFIRACDAVKLLNITRGLGLFLTIREYQYMNFEMVLKILLMCHRYYECLEICKQFNKPRYIPMVIADWSVTKIKTSSDMEDNELLNEIQEHSKGFDSRCKIPMAEVAKTAFAEGRFGLARSLAMMEKSPELKVLSLIILDDNNLAIQESLKTNCPEFILSLILKLKEQLTTVQLTKLLMVDLSDIPLYLYFERNNYEFLFDFYRQTDRLIDLAHCILSHNKNNESLTPFLPQIKDIYGIVRNDPIIKQDFDLLQRNEELIKFQESLTNTFGLEFINFTLDQTLEKLIEMNQPKHIKVLMKKFKINDKKYYHIMCRTLIKGKKFDELHEFAKQKKSPIGYYPFYKYLKKAGNDKEAAKYILMMNNMPSDEKKRILFECKGYYELIQLFTKEKDILALKDLYQNIPVNEAQLRSLITETMSKI